MLAVSAGCHQPAFLDTDNDFLPDVWELRNGFDPDDATDANQDNDRDGFTNREEFQGIADPNDPRPLRTGRLQIWPESVLREDFECPAL
jgi:hypothetical protein